ncbi:1-phosphatidylinositol 4,5-bisphosphate phosphodiesterase epsilon-1 [Ditylenchus destructor]|nr:1-phosphatidylinositol 4,5-bisphosphate phosphodiesterase epsilon-1 [Ditylenchus destructor]
MSTTRESSTETADRYTFGYNSELSGNQETSLSTAKRLRQRLQRQQSGQSGRRYTGESSGASSLVGTPTESGRCFTFTAAQRILRTEERKPSVNQNLSEMLLDAIHMDDVNLVDRLLMSHCNTKVLSSSPSIGSTNTFTDLAQRRHGANVHRRSNASSTISTHSGCKNSSHCTLANTIHLAILHSTLHNSKRGIVELLLKSGYDPNSVALCHCKGNCAASGNVPLSSVLPRTHSSVTPEMCSTCSNLRVTSILDQSPLAVAVKAQRADVNALDEDANSPLMLAVRESPLNWHVVHMLILFGARISQKNARGICPLDLAPELRKLQETCIENLFQAACSPPSSHGSMAHSGMAATSGDHDLSLNGVLSADKSAKVSSVSAPKATRKTHVDAESLLLPASFCERGSLSKAPLSPRTSTAPSISTVSMMENLSVKDKDTRRKSFVSLQLNRRSKAPRESPILDNVSWEQAWECLTKMASNSECIDLILRNILKSCTQIDDSALSSVAEYQQSTPTYQKDSKRKLIGTLVSLVNFCYSCLQKSGSRQFAALACLNKIADAGLVDSLFGTPPVILHSSRLTKRSHDFDDSCPSPVNSSVAEDPPPIVTAINRRQTGESTSGPSLILHSFYRKHGLPNTNVHPVRMGDLYKAFASMQPATVIASLHNAITMQNREAVVYLQTVAIIALNPSMHMLLCELQVDEVLIQLGDRVGNRVNIFQTFDNITREPSSNLDLRKANVNSPNEDDYIISTLRTAHFSQEFSKTSMSAEGMVITSADFYILCLKLSKNAIASTSEAITEESPSAICSPAILGISLMNYTGCIIEECEDKSESPIPPLLTLPSRPSTPHSAPQSQTAGPSFQGTSSTLCPPKTTEIASHKPAVPHISTDSTAPKSTCAAAPPTIVTHNITNVVTANGAAGPSNVINLLCLNNLEAHLAKFSMVIDSILMLRLLLHKLSWDLSLVAKKRITASSANDPHRSSTAVGNSDHRAYSSCSLGNSFNSVEIPRPKRFSSGAKELRKERRKRLGTDTSSGSSKSKKTNSSTSSVHKHLPKYIQSLFRGRMGTDPCRRSHTRESVTSGSEAVLEFTKKLQNIPPTRRETMRQAFKNSGQQDSGSTEQKARNMGYTYLPELEVNGASPPRSPATGSNAETAALLGHTTKDCRRPSSPQVCIVFFFNSVIMNIGHTWTATNRNSTTLSHFSYFVNSPEIVGSGPASDSDCAPLLLSGGSGAQISSRKSSDESSMCGWTCSSRASSAMSQRSSSGGLRLSTFSAEPPQLEPEFHYQNEPFLVRRVIASGFRIARQTLNSPQHPQVKNWCTDILAIIGVQLVRNVDSINITNLSFFSQDTEESCKFESNERVNDEYLDEEAALMAAIQLCVEEERKRKLFHSHIFESEASMKKLYVQTAKRLPAFGCKTVRLLCLSSSILCLLDGTSKMVLKRRVGGGISKHQLLLEFRGAKWQLIAPSYNVLKSISMTLWEIMQSRASILIQKSFNKSARPSLAFDTQIHSAQSSRTNSYSSTTSSFRNSLCCGEPITLFRLELERYIAVSSPNVVIIGNDGETEKLSFMQDLNGDDHYSSNIGVGGLLNTDKIGLVGIILDNLETFHKHNKQLMKYVEDSNAGTANPLEDSPEVKPYEPVQPIVGSAHGVTLIPLNTLTFDLDIIQKIQHGTTVIRYEPDTGRSTLCRLVLDASCSMVSWHRIPYGAKESRDKTFIKAIESVDSYDLDIETIYRRHSVEEICMLNDNDFFYFLAPQQIAQYWMSGLQKVVKSIQEQTRHPDRRAIWLKKLYLQLYNECERDSINSEFRRLGPRPVDALHAFGGRVEKWRNLGMSQTISTNPRPTESSSSTEGRAKSRLKQMTIAVTRRVRPPSIRSQLSSQSGPGPNSPGYLLKPRSEAIALSEAGDLDSLYTPRSRTPTSSSYGGRSVGGRSIKSWRSRGGETPNSGSMSSGQVCLTGISGKEYQEKPITFTEFCELFRLFSTRMRKDLKLVPIEIIISKCCINNATKYFRDLFNDCVIHSSANSHMPKRCERDKSSPRIQSRLESLTGSVICEFVPGDILTRNTAFHLCHLNEKQHKVFNAMALASINR